MGSDAAVDSAAGVESKAACSAAADAEAEVAADMGTDVDASAAGWLTWRSWSMGSSSSARS